MVGDRAIIRMTSGKAKNMDGSLPIQIEKEQIFLRLSAGGSGDGIKRQWENKVIPSTDDDHPVQGLIISLI